VDGELSIFIVLMLVAALAVVAKWSRQPYPIVFLIGGIALAFVPSMPVMALKPDLVFLVFLPPLIFGDAYVTDVRQFVRYLEPITLLATGLVVVTSVTVAYVAHWVIGLPLDVGFVLGAILSPTDTVATDAIAEETGMPKRLQTILGGESLINDATGLVLYKFAIAAVIAGTFSFGGALLQFGYVAVAGIAVGVLGGIAGNRISRFLFEHDLTDDVIAVTITLVTPFVVYLAADRIGASGVLAAAAGGFVISRRGGGMHTPEARLVGRSVWNMLFFVFNGALFILLGLQLRSIFTELAIFPAATLAQYALSIAGTVIVVRIAWVFVIAWLRRALRRSSLEREGPPPPGSWLFVLGWSGMRGIVSLAAALSIPETAGAGAPFPARDLILFITFAVIIVTLLGQGLSLPWLLRRLDVVEHDGNEMPVARARVRVAEAALRRLTTLEAAFGTTKHWEVAGRLQAKFSDEMTHFQSHVDGSLVDGDAAEHEIERELVREALAAQRIALDDMRYVGEINDEVFRRMQYDIDLAETRLLN
jgi:CPA1 family monovalent cation:H+ antiporter